MHYTLCALCVHQCPTVRAHGACADLLVKPLKQQAEEARPESERPRKKAALSVPLMTQLPVTGGINTIVDTFLKRPGAEPHKGAHGMAVR